VSQPLRDYLESQANLVEDVLTAHRAPSRVTGGTVGPRLIRFFVDPEPRVRVSAIRRLTEDLALALRVSSLKIDQGREGLVVSFPNPKARAVSLLDLLPVVEPLPDFAALLGLTEDGAPLLARLSSPQVAHILIAGTTGSGKSVLLRTIALSLTLAHHPRALRLICLDPKGRAFRPLAGLPHLLRPPVSAISEAREALASLVRVMEWRDRRRESAPRVVVLLDELAELVQQGGEGIAAPLVRLAQRGREAGIHLVAATQRPSAAVLGGLLRANFPLRLVGRVTSATDARVAAGRGGTEAHLLEGRGDFLAVGSGAEVIRFQAAYVSGAEMRREVEVLCRRWS